MKYIYIVMYEDYSNPDFIYDEETFKKEYKKYILTPPIYSNKDYWEKYTRVLRYELNSDKYEGVDSEDISE